MMAYSQKFHLVANFRKISLPIVKLGSPYQAGNFVHIKVKHTFYHISNNFEARLGPPKSRLAGITTYCYNLTMQWDARMTKAFAFAQISLQIGHNTANTIT